MAKSEDNRLHDALDALDSALKAEKRFPSSSDGIHTAVQRILRLLAIDKGEPDPDGEENSKSGE